MQDGPDIASTDYLRNEVSAFLDQHPRVAGATGIGLGVVGVAIGGGLCRAMLIDAEVATTLGQALGQARAISGAVGTLIGGVGTAVYGSVVMLTGVRNERLHGQIIAPNVESEFTPLLDSFAKLNNARNLILGSTGHQVEAANEVLRDFTRTFETTTVGDITKADSGSRTRSEGSQRVDGPAFKEVNNSDYKDDLGNWC